MNSYTVAELKKLAKENKLTGYSKMNKADLYSLLIDKVFNVKKEMEDEPKEEIQDEIKELEDGPGEEIKNHNLDDFYQSNKGYLKWYKNIQNTKKEEKGKLTKFITINIDQKIKDSRNDLEKIEWMVINSALTFQNKLQLKKLEKDIISMFPDASFGMNEDELDSFISYNLYGNVKYFVNKYDHVGEANSRYENPFYTKDTILLDRNDYKQYLRFLYPQVIDRISSCIKLKVKKLFQESSPDSGEGIYNCFQILEKILFGRNLIEEDMFDAAIRISRLI